MANCSFKTTDLPEPVDGIVEGHNFTQANPNTAIYSGYGPITFRNCNLINCQLPASSTTQDCMTGQISFCSHLIPEWITDGHITQCPVDCSHIVQSDTITVDGVIVDTNYVYEHKGV